MQVQSMDKVEVNFSSAVKTNWDKSCNRKKNSKDYENLRITEKREVESTYLEC